MTSRSIVLSTAALLLFTAAAPVQLGFSPTPAVAQEVGREVRAALEADLSDLEPGQLRENIKLLRDAVRAGAFRGPDRQTVRRKIVAYREAIQQLRDERQQARQDDQQSEQLGRGERSQRQRGQGRGSERKAERRAERAERQEARQDDQQAEQPGLGERSQRQRGQGRGSERKAERRAERAERQAERRDERAERRDERTERQSERQDERTERRSERRDERQQPERQAQSPAQGGLSQDMVAALRDGRPASELEPAELRTRIQSLRGAVQSGALSRDQRGQVQARIQADREVLQSRRAARREQAEPEQTREQRPRRRTEDAPQQEVDQRAREIISDDRPASDLDDDTLRTRLRENRDVLQTGRLTRGEVQQLRQQLREDREELRDRVASRQEEAEQSRDRASDGDRPRRDRTSRRERASDGDRPRGDRASRERESRDVVVDVERHRSADDLSDRELERRVRTLNRQLRQERLARRDAEIAREMVERDRRELRRRLHRDRERRRERRREARSRNERVIEFNVGLQMPPVIYAAEAMPRDIEMQLVAPPERRVSRSYSYHEIATNPDVREMMPGIEVDTLNFDFGSAEVRPEEIDKLDEIAWVIEDIVAERPNEVFLIEGHTDAVGSDAANDVLSERRAQAVMEALLDYYDIYPENLQTVGLGERYLRIWTQEPEEENRRVTVRRITPLLVGARG